MICVKKESRYQKIVHIPTGRDSYEIDLFSWQLRMKLETVSKQKGKTNKHCIYFLVKWMQNEYIKESVLHP